MTHRLRTFLSVLLAGAVAVAAGCGSSSKKASVPDAVSKPTSFQGAVATPPKPAPVLRLKDSTGKPFNLAGERGKAVLVTFLYTHCPDVCPLIAGNLHTAVRKLGARASQLQIVAVSTDPRGDTPKTVKHFLAVHQMTGLMRYLIGSKSQLAALWKPWGIIAHPAKADPSKVEHSAPIYGISASGKITTLYPANFNPAQIVNDVPILAKQ
jgi:protein SCO1